MLFKPAGREMKLHWVFLREKWDISLWVLCLLLLEVWAPSWLSLSVGSYLVRRMPGLIQGWWDQDTPSPLSPDGEIKEWVLMERWGVSWCLAGEPCVSHHGWRRCLSCWNSVVVHRAISQVCQLLYWIVPVGSGPGLPSLCRELLRSPGKAAQGRLHWRAEAVNEPRSPARMRI